VRIVFKYIHSTLNKRQSWKIRRRKKSKTIMCI